uniref:Reverse transcriptase domain-containing protein n=1 Tax=Tanacetum cinerariifolium TaxID=118510 RepID=A0A699GZC9_TANCI|nr:reverse transcriptase domain-containing protein [Tanacetum cinerariifolium]
MCLFGTYAYRRMPFGLCNAPATFHRCILAIFHDMIKKSVEVFMDDFSVFGSSFDHCLNNLDKMLQRCKDAHLVLNWEKCHFMVKEGIVIARKANKEEYPIFRDHAYMIELDGAVSVRKTPIKGGGFVRYPFQLVELDKLYLSSSSSIQILDDPQILKLKELRPKNSKDEVSLSQAAVHVDYSQAKEESRLMASGHERDGTSYPVVVRNVRKELCRRREVFGVSWSSTMAYADDVGLPRTLENIIGTTQTLEIKSHTHYEHGTFESFTYWRIASEEVVEEDAKSSNANTLLGLKAFMKLLLLRFLLLLLSYT